MTILAIDTSFNPSGVALASGGRVLGEWTLDLPGTHSARLMPQIDQLLAACGVEKKDLSALALTVGPGFFTGLRIGLATGLGLALALDIPVVQVSSLRLLAAGAAVVPARIWAVGDARRGLLYAAGFEFDGEKLARTSQDAAISPERLAEMIDAPAVLVGNGARAYWDVLGREGLVLSPASLDTPNPGLLALLGGQGLRKGQAVPAEQTAPRYCRPSDAEIRFGLPLDEYNLVE